MAKTRVTTIISATPKPVLVAVILLWALVLTFLLWPRSQSKLFPVLASGSYVGAITGLSEDPAQSLSVYIERIENTDGLLMVLFEPGWKAKFIPLFVPNGTEEGETPSGYQPLRLQKADKTFALFGSATASGYTGALEENGLPVGQWALQPVSAKDLRVGSPSIDENFDFVSWLRTKGRHRIRMQELVQINDKMKQKYASLKKTTDVVNERSLLKEAGRAYQGELEAEVKTLREQDAGYKKRLNELVAELEQLRRITKRGRSIELARRVVKRENKWYHVNWSQGEDLSALEETLAGSRSIDLQKLNQRFDQALEIKRLKNQIAQEQARIQKLKRVFQEKLKDGKEQEEKNKGKPWWRKLDSVFG